MADPSEDIWKICLFDDRPGWHITSGSERDKADALEVRRQVYCDELGYKWELAEDGFDVRASICVVRTGKGRPIASLRIVGPRDRPLEVEQFVQIDDILPPNSRPGEISRFCVLPPFRRISSSVHFALFQFAFDLAQAERFSHFIVWAKPTIMPIYRYLLFQVVEGVSFRHPELGNDLHHVLVLDLQGLAVRYRRARHPFSALLEPGAHHRS